MTIYLAQEMMKKNIQLSQQPFLSFVAQIFSDRFPKPLFNQLLLFLFIIPSLIQMHLCESTKHIHFKGNFSVCLKPKQHFVHVQASVHLWSACKNSKSSWDNFLTLHTADCRGDIAATKGSVPSEHLVSSLPSPLCFWSWHFFMLRCIRDVTFFVDVLKCVLELFWLSTK